MFEKNISEKPVFKTRQYILNVRNCFALKKFSRLMEICDSEDIQIDLWLFTIQSVMFIKYIHRSFNFSIQTETKEYMKQADRTKLMIKNNEAVNIMIRCISLNVETITTV